MAMCGERGREREIIKDLRLGSTKLVHLICNLLKIFFDNEEKSYILIGFVRKHSGLSFLFYQIAFVVAKGLKFSGNVKAKVRILVKWDIVTRSKHNGAWELALEICT